MKPKLYYFTIGGGACGKERPRKSKHLKLSKKGKPYHPFFTPKDTMDYEEKVKTCFRSLYQKLDDDAHRWKLEVWVNKQGVTVRATALEKLKPRGVRADIDNLAKVLMDSLQGQIWHNDSQVVELNIVENE